MNSPERTTLPSQPAKGGLGSRLSALWWAMRMSRDLRTFNLIRMGGARQNGDGLARLRVRGLDSQILLRVAPNPQPDSPDDDRRPFWELFYLLPYDGEIPFASFNRVVDLGANVGLFLAFLLFRGARPQRYVGVEPDPATFRVLQRQVSELGLTERSRLLNIAASDKAGTLRFVTTGHSILHRVSDSGDTQVEARPVARILDEAGEGDIDLLKIDIEGGEAAIMPTAPDWAPRARRMALELHHGLDLDWLSGHLRPLGFRTFAPGTLLRDAYAAVREDLADEIPAKLR